MILDKGLFINDVIIIGRYPRFSLQTTHVLKVHCILSIHWWSEVKPAVIYEQPPISFQDSSSVKDSCYGIQQQSSTKINTNTKFSAASDCTELESSMTRVTPVKYQKLTE